MRAELVRLAFASRLPLIVNVVNSGVVAAVVYGSVSTAVVLGWLALMWAVALARYGMVRAFRRSDVQHSEMARWGRRLALGAGATGFLWGIAAIVVIDGEHELLHAFIAFVVAGMTAGALMVSASYLPAFCAFAVPATVLLAVAFIAAGKGPHYVMAGMTMLFLALSIAIARKWNANIRAAAYLQRDLAASQRRFRDFAEAASDWYYELDQALANHTIDAEDSSDQAVFLRRFLRDLRSVPVPGEDGVVDEIRRCVESRQPFRDIDYSYSDADGLRRWVRLGGKPVFDNDGLFLGYRGVVSDITERKKDDEIRDGEHRMLETVATGTSLPGLLDDVARWMEDAIRGCRGSILLLDGETTLRHGAAPSLPDAYVEAIDGVRIGPDAGSCGTAAHDKRLVVSENIETDPNWREWRSTALAHGLRACWSIPIQSGGGTVLGTLAIYRSEPSRPTETELKLMQVAANLAGIAIERRRAEESLRQSNRLEAIGQLTAGVAHEFNNLLQAVLAGLETLRDELSERGETRDRLETIMASVLRGRELTLNLMSFVGARDVVSSVFAVDEALASSIELLRATLGEDIEITCSAPAGMWPIDVNRGEFEAAILNLALNARDAMADGGRLVVAAVNRTVETEAGPADGNRPVPGDYVEVSVADDGAGIPPETIGRVFDPFFTTKEAGKGTGLGLSMVYGFVRHQAAGHIEIDSEVGRGTTVRLYLPRAPIGAHSTKASRVDRPPMAVDEPRILVVEDDPIVRDALAGILKRMGYAIETADAAEDALDILRNSDGFDLLLTDIMMSGPMSGVELAEAAARLKPELRTLYMTGYGHEELEKHGIGSSGRRLLHKPFRTEELSEALSEALAIRAEAE